jgi:hypothetical protein
VSWSKRHLASLADVLGAAQWFVFEGKPAPDLHWYHNFAELAEMEEGSSSAAPDPAT